MTLALRIMGYGLVAVLVVLVAAVLWLRTSLPKLSGSERIAGLGAAVDIVRDRYGVPHIYARSIEDAYFGLGYVHVQDRLWQMDFQRRVGQGRLAEILGPAALNADRFLRTLGVEAAAQASVSHLSDATRAILDAYVAGANAALGARSGAPAPEFLILGHRPGPWRAVDALAWTRMMAWDLSGNWRDELLRARLARRLDPVRIDELWVNAPATVPLALAPMDDALGTLALDALWDALPVGRGQMSASNNWVVGGQHTASGAPILANDPHLTLGAPSIWYLAHLSAPGLELIGATLPGVPFVVLGRNRDIAWGFTNTGPDTQDLFIERLDPADPARYLTPDGSAAFTTRTEIIAVKNGTPVTITVRTSRHGPVISDIVTSGAEAVPGGHVLALAWTGLDANDRTVQMGVKVAGAADWPAFVESLRDFGAPQQNIVYADRAGNIGFYAPARIPVRRTGRGAVPVPGWDGAHDWIDTIPFAQLPQLYNPPSGRIVTANNKIVGDDYPYFLSDDWEPPYRAQRIAGRLATMERQRIEDHVALQADRVSLMAREFLPLLLAAPGLGARENQARSRLAQWDATMDADRPEPLIFFAWYRALHRAVLADELGDLYDDLGGMRPAFMRRVLDDWSHWCDVVPTDVVETCESRIAHALADSLDALSARYGTNLDAWRWSEAHRVHHAHPVFSRVPLLDRAFSLHAPRAGGNFTVDRASYNNAGPNDPFRSNHGPSYRAIYDLGDPERSLYVQSTGQSGNPFSPHYRDLGGLWQRHGYAPMWTERARIEAAGARTLRLEPVR